MVSIYTGQSPIEHGVEAVDRQLSEKHETLGKALERQGVQAAFFGVNPVFVVDRGLANGFTHWQAEVGWHAGRLNQAVFEWVEHSRNARQPTFLHVHYFDPHCPYIPPRGRTVSPPIVASGQLVPAERLDEMGGCYRIDHADGTPVRDLDVYFDRYDSELHVVDEAIDRLLNRLAEHGLLGPEDRLVVTADHGEAFWEHDDYGHSHTLWAETTHVPLVIWDHDGAGTIETPVGLTALFRDLHSVDVGTPIRPELGGPVVQSTKAAGVPWVAVIDNDERWLSDGTNAWMTNPISDPGDLALQTAALHPEPEALTQARSVATPAPPLSPSDEEREQLRALGYSL